MATTTTTNIASTLSKEDVPTNISLGHRIWCQHRAFSGVGAFVASFVPVECPKGGGMCGIFGKPLKRAFWRCIGWGGGGPEPYFFCKLAVTVDKLGFFCLLWSSFRQTAPYPYPHDSNIWAYEGQVIWVDLLHLMCRRHVQHGSPQDPNMLKTLTNNYLGHPGDAWCNLQHQAHQSARNQRWQNFSNRLPSWDMRPQYLDSARQNASIYLISLSSNSTICRST